MGRQLSVAFGSMAGVAVVLCLALLLLLARVASTLEDVREDGRSVQRALVLALTVREHYQHESRTVLQVDGSQLQDHTHWLVDLQRQAEELARRVPVRDRPRVRRVLRQSELLDKVYREEVVPAASADDRATLRRAHGRASILIGRATVEADALVDALDARMVRARNRAHAATQAALFGGGAGVLVIILLASFFSWRLRRVIFIPLRRVAEVARRLGEGESIEPIGPVGGGEIGVMAEAFDTMALRLKERERQLVESERMAAIGQLAAGVAHEINNPIGVIRGYLRTMLPEADGEQLREELQILDDEADACQRIVEDLVAYARAPNLRSAEVELAQLLEEASGRLSAADQDDCPGADVRVRAEAHTIEADPVRLRQVVVNLLRNARQAAPAAPIDLLGSTTSEGGYVISVEDRGPGIPEEKRSRIFEPFHSDHPGGTGLGLAVCQGIVRAHGGTIRALPREGGGTRFVVSLPRDGVESNQGDHP